MLPLAQIYIYETHYHYCGCVNSIDIVYLYTMLVIIHTYVCDVKENVVFIILFRSFITKIGQDGILSRPIRNSNN